MLGDLLPNINGVIGKTFIHVKFQNKSSQLVTRNLHRVTGYDLRVSVKRSKKIISFSFMLINYVNLLYNLFVDQRIESFHLAKRKNKISSHIDLALCKEIKQQIK